MLAGKNITLGITGGIAVYKAAQLTSNLKAGGADVRVIMTRSASAFVSPLTFQTLSGNRVYSELFEPVMEWKVQHIELAAISDLLVVVLGYGHISGQSGRDCRRFAVNCDYGNHLPGIVLSGYECAYVSKPGGPTQSDRA